MTDLIQTRASTARGLNKVEVVQFEAYKSKKKPKQIINDEAEQISGSSNEEFNIKKARYDVIKFGMSGFEKKKKAEAKIQLAIKLGAKPPKNKSVNYKLLMGQRKREKVEDEKESSLQQVGKNAIGKSNAKGKSFDRKRRKVKVGDLLDVYGKVKRVAE